MDQHPVPQNISSYEFRLVGDMTLKQFLQLAGGCGVGVLFYKLPLPFIVKWPLVFIAVGIGILLAFVPIQGRSFSQWLLAFIRAIYSPTEYYWSPEKIAQNSELIAQETKIPNKARLGGSTFLNNINKLISSIRTNRMPKVKSEIKIKTDPILVPSPPPPSNDKVIYASLPPIAEVKPVGEVGVAQYTDLVPTPEMANILTGLVCENNDKIIEGAIVEIINQETGMPVRALRSNKLGQFSIATPLSPGKYIISSELDKFVFEPVLIEVKNEIIKPILIKANI